MALIELYVGQRQAYEVSTGETVAMSTRAVVLLSPILDLALVPREGGFYDLPLELPGDLLVTPTVVREREGVCGY